MVEAAWAGGSLRAMGAPWGDAGPGGQGPSHCGRAGQGTRDSPSLWTRPCQGWDGMWACRWAQLGRAHGHAGLWGAGDRACCSLAVGRKGSTAGSQEGAVRPVSVLRDITPVLLFLCFTLSYRQTQCLTTFIIIISGFYLKKYIANIHMGNVMPKMPNREQTTGVQTLHSYSQRSLHSGHLSIHLIIHFVYLQ